MLRLGTVAAVTATGRIATAKWRVRSARSAIFGPGELLVTASERAESGSGCVSTIRPSGAPRRRRPAALETSSRRPVAWLGSAMTGRGAFSQLQSRDPARRRGSCVCTNRTRRIPFARRERRSTFPRAGWSPPREGAPRGSPTCRASGERAAPDAPAARSRGATCMLREPILDLASSILGDERHLSGLERLGDDGQTVAFRSPTGT